MQSSGPITKAGKCSQNFKHYHDVRYDIKTLNIWLLILAMCWVMTLNLTLTLHREVFCRSGNELFVLDVVIGSFEMMQETNPLVQTVNRKEKNTTQV